MRVKRQTQQEMGYKSVGAWIPADLHKRIIRKARATDQSVAQMIRRLLGEEVENE